MEGVDESRQNTGWLKLLHLQMQTSSNKFPSAVSSSSTVRTVLRSPGSRLEAEKKPKTKVLLTNVASC